MGLLIRSYHGKMNTMAISHQNLSRDCSKILPRSYKDIKGGYMKVANCILSILSTLAIRKNTFFFSRNLVFLKNLFLSEMAEKNEKKS